MTEFQIAVIGGGALLLISWLGWLTQTVFGNRKEIWHQINVTETRVTKLEAVGYLDYQAVDELLDKKLAPIQETLNAIAINEHVKPDRRKDK